jgi:hypothetical protein
MLRVLLQGCFSINEIMRPHDRKSLWVLASSALLLLSAAEARSDYIQPQKVAFNATCDIVIEGKTVILGGCYTTPNYIEDLRTVIACRSAECYGPNQYIKQFGVFFWFEDQSSPQTKVAWNKGTSDTAIAELGIFKKEGKCWTRKDSRICVEEW